MCDLPNLARTSIYQQHAERYRPHLSIGLEDGATEGADNGFPVPRIKRDAAKCGGRPHDGNPCTGVAP